MVSCHFTKSLVDWETVRPSTVIQFHVQSVRDVAREPRSKSSHNVVEQPANIDDRPTPNVNARPQRCGVIVKSPDTLPLDYGLHAKQNRSRFWLHILLALSKSHVVERLFLLFVNAFSRLEATPLLS